MAKKIIWDFNQAERLIYVSDKSTEAENEKSFEFKLYRYKDVNTSEEHLQIDCTYNGNENGSINTFIYKLDEDLKQFKKYGVAFSGNVYTSLKTKIENIYLSLEPIETESINVSINANNIKDLLTMLGEVIGIYKEQDYFDEKYFHIPVEDFNQLILESKFADYELNEIKKYLSDKGFTKCGTGRYTNLVRINKKPTRVLSFKLDKIKDFIVSEENTGQTNEQ